MVTLPTFESYGEYSSDNYGAHTLVFTDERGCDFYYSYRTLVAVRVPFAGMVVHENDWGPTTGKHLNWIDGGDKEAKASRVDSETFEQRVAEMLGSEAEEV